jgi:hypothetical protein
MTTNHFRTTARLCGLALSCCAALHAQIPDKFPALTFDQGRGTLEVVERLRYEDRAETFDFDSATHSVTDGSWFVQRLRVGAIWKAAPDWLVQVQLQDAREWGSDRPKVPFILGAEGNNALNLRLASITWGDQKTSPVQFTLGRQTLVLGEERLVGIGDWNNFSRTFDAGKLVWAIVPAKTSLTAFVSSVVTMQPTTSGASWQLNRSSTDDLFSGVDLTQKLSADDTAEAYVLWRDKKNNDPIYTAPTAPIPAGARSAAAYDIAQDIYTIGGRFIRVPKPGALDAEFEAAYQGGHVDRQTLTFTGPYGGSTAKLAQDAWALHSLIGYTPQGAPGKLRVDFEYNIASGDSHRTDDKNGSFMNLFPSNHKFYGFMDAFAWKNMEEFVATLRFVPLPKTTLRVDYHVFTLFTTSDAWYRANAVATVRPLNAAARSASRDAGDEIDVTATWAFRPWANFDLGWSRFMPGTYLEQTGAHSDARFLYVQTTLKF